MMNWVRMLATNSVSQKSSVPAIFRHLWLLPAASSLAVLALMDGLAARTGGAKVIMGAVRVTFWGGVAMAITSGIGWLVGAIA